VPHLVTILLPLQLKNGTDVPAERFASVRHALTERHGGLTAFTRAPAEGRWKDGGETVTQDDIVVFEVLVEPLDRAWWSDYRGELETLFEQDEVVVRVHEVEVL
jgi:hypothetical protein